MKLFARNIGDGKAYMQYFLEKLFGANFDNNLTTFFFNPPLISDTVRKVS